MDWLLQLWHNSRVAVLFLLLALALLVCYIRLVQSPRSAATRNDNVPRPSIQKFYHEKPETYSQNPKNLPTTPEIELGQDATQQPARRQVPRSQPKRVQGRKAAGVKTIPKRTGGDVFAIQPYIFYSTLSGTTKQYARDLSNDLTRSRNESLSHPILEPRLLDITDIDLDDYFISPPKDDRRDTEDALDSPKKAFYLILVPTYNVDTYLNNFIAHLTDTHHDFRIDTAPLSALLGYAVFGFGDKTGWPTEAEGFCSQAREADKCLARLTAGKRAYPLGMGDVSSDAQAKLRDWRQGVEVIMLDLAQGKSLGEGAPGSGDAIESDEEDDETRRSTQNIDDLENLGQTVSSLQPRPKGPVPIDFTKPSNSNKPAAQIKEMVPKDSPTHAALTKQGYTIVGSHSGVKLCRWTKSALRGRGSCYKYSFYGIRSHLCMETTPSLSCSNKCVFCWRHGTNPVGTTWRWQVDPPQAIFDGVKKGHYQKIKQMRGVPGVRAERYEEAMRIRHCALSLVGEPIFYPHINEFVDMLHAERISSFLVCNAQHPDQLAAMKTVTQLYVSIDASNKDSLRKIDRPLHRDFWERFCRCLDILREKRHQQRTVFRLTLVKGFNIEDEAEGYADLVARALPCFVEVKGVTFCGTTTSAGAGLTMQNVPFYDEVCTFVKALDRALERRGLDYGIAAEHAHSCCVLLGSKRFLVDGKWNTTIDYDRFFELLDTGEPFAPEDYVKETPEWALWGKGGFNPEDERVDRKGNKIENVDPRRSTNIL